MSLADRHIDTAVRAAVALAAWLWAIAASAQERVRRWDWRKKDSVWVDITRFDIDERLYFGDMVASREDIHYHPSNFRYPSGLDWKSDNNDIRESAFIQDRTHNKVVFKIFIPIDNSYITFDDFSTIHDFKNKIERCANRY